MAKMSIVVVPPRIERSYVHPKAINACFSISCYEESHIDGPDIECD